MHADASRVLRYITYDTIIIFAIHTLYVFSVNIIVSRIVLRVTTDDNRQSAHGKLAQDYCEMHVGYCTCAQHTDPYISDRVICIQYTSARLLRPKHDLFHTDLQNTDTFNRVQIVYL
jgi:hypothetical protein